LAPCRVRHRRGNGRIADNCPSEPPPAIPDRSVRQCRKAFASSRPEGTRATRVSVTAGSGSFMDSRRGVRRGDYRQHCHSVDDACATRSQWQCCP
jgi:hypothetical protein